MIKLIVMLCLCLLAVSAQGATIYVSKAGTSPDGTTWETAWNTIAEVNSDVASGDSVVFGQGLWNDAALGLPVGFSSTETYYVCSSLTAKPRIYGADSVSGWTLYSGAIYQTSKTVSGSGEGLWQADTLLERQTSLGAVTEGEWYYSGGTIYAHIGGGGDPDNAPMWHSVRSVITFDDPDFPCDDQQKNITFYGLHLKYGANAGVVNTPASSCGADNITFRECNLSCGSGWRGDNVGVFRINTATSAVSYVNWRITNCSLGVAFSHSRPPEQSDYAIVTVNSASIMAYETHSFLIDSNVFYDGGSDACIYFKTGLPGNNVVNTVIFGNEFANNRWNDHGVKCYGYIDSLYVVGNRFDGLNIHPDRNSTAVAENLSGPVYILNNTIINSSDVVNSPYDYAGNNDREPFTYVTAKYNIFYNSGAVGMTVPDGVGDASDVVWTVDSNQYYGSSYSFYIDDNSTGTVNWSGWQAEGYDNNSVQTDPSLSGYIPGNAVSFNDTLVVYDDQSPTDTLFYLTTTQYGAVQPSGPQAPVANFSADVTSGDAPLTVTFTDLSSNTPTSWSWDFGDESAASNDQNPTHEYSSAGTYTVTLTATNAEGSDDEVKTDYISVSTPTGGDKILRGILK